MGGNCTNVNECILKNFVAMPGKCVRQELDLDSNDETACCFDLFGIYGGNREDIFGSGVIAADEPQQQRTFNESPFNMFKDSTCEEIDGDCIDANHCIKKGYSVTSHKCAGPVSCCIAIF